MENIDISLQELLGDAENMQLPADFKEMEAASSEYDELVERGLIVPRGYSLLAVNDGSALQQLGIKNAHPQTCDQSCEIKIKWPHTRQKHPPPSSIR